MASDSASGEDEGESNDPDNEEDDDEYLADHWDDDDGFDIIHEHSCCLHNGHSQSQLRPEAAEHQGEQCTHAPQAIGHICQVSVSIPC